MQLAFQQSIIAVIKQSTAMLAQTMLRQEKTTYMRPICVRERELRKLRVIYHMVK